jgi:hypothetical protein
MDTVKITQHICHIEGSLLYEFIWKLIEGVLFFAGSGPRWYISKKSASKIAPAQREW